MRRTILVGLLPIVAAPQVRQSSLRVLHVNPASSIVPTEAVTVTFDRPVVGIPGRVIDPRSVATLEPPLPVRFDWRDPSTLRLVPTKPWPVGEVVTLVVDTSLVALDGSRLTRPVRIPLRVKGPAVRASVPELRATNTATLPPDGRLRLLFSSEVDTYALERIVRYEIDPTRGCRRQVIPTRLALERRLSIEDDWRFLGAIGSDSLARAAARVVELIPASPLEDPLPAGLEAVDLSLRTSGTLGPFSNPASNEARERRDREAAAGRSLGSWDSGWWTPWEHSEKRDDRVTWFARALPAGVYSATYVARATTAGRFIRPPSRAEEMYNAAVSGRSEGGTFVVLERRK